MQVKIVTKVSKTGEEIDFTINIPDTLEGMMEEYGELIVYKLALEKVKAAAINAARGMNSRGWGEERIKQTMLKEWSPVKRLKTAMSMSILASQVDIFGKEEEDADSE